jgi:hypothetical protein
MSDAAWNQAEERIEALLPDNVQGLITPEALRDAFTELVDAAIALQRKVDSLERRVTDLEQTP